MTRQFLATNTTTYNQQYILYLFVAFIPEYCKWFGSLKKKKTLDRHDAMPSGSAEKLYLQLSKNAHFYSQHSQYNVITTDRLIWKHL